jgi:enhancer of polycomb-like protein
MLGSLSFRPRPLDVNKSIPIIRDLPELDDSNNNRSVPQMPTGMEAEEEEEAHIQEAIKRSLKAFSEQNKEEGIEIPTPRVVIVEGYDQENVKPWVKPQTYVRTKGKKVQRLLY